MYTIIRKDRIAGDVYSMTIEAPHVTTNAKAGQFVIIIVDESGERIPLTIANAEQESGELTLIFQAIGYSTKKLAALEAGDKLFAVLGPLGEAAPIEGFRKVLMIGGGVGIAPLYPQIKALYQAGAEVHAILGGRSAELVILRDECTQYTHELEVVTDDGSLGTKGLVTDALEAHLKSGEDFDLVVAIGPLRMMQAVVGVTKRYDVKTNVSLNPIMIDGTGMCGGCRVHVGGKMKFACVDGPDFDGHLVDFEELISRQGMYRTEEAHTCRLLEVKP
ncbi:MAG: ferredoxin/flavodoxin---NADP+ reductase [Clostridiales bacterium]|jgi:ferredoxin--NADP+ reductase|nr:ferredoxin/flavodoxin---NADP+ reductase [Clostridiales bacterium]